MKESIGYTVTLNIIIVFITIVVAFLCAALIYFKSNKVSNIITTAIEKYEGYDTLAINEINVNLSSIGYNINSIESDCLKKNPIYDGTAKTTVCYLLPYEFQNAQGQLGYCVYACYEEDAWKDGNRLEGYYNGDYYFYKIRTNMMINIPIVNDLMNIPIYSNTNRLYNFSKENG